MRCILINEEDRVVNIITFDGSAGSYDPAPYTMVEYPEELKGPANIGWYYHRDKDRALPERPETE